MQNIIEFKIHYPIKQVVVEEVVLEQADVDEEMLGEEEEEEEEEEMFHTVPRKTDVPAPVADPVPEKDKPKRVKKARRTVPKPAADPYALTEENEEKGTKLLEELSRSTN